jgi:hypothetical protein
VQIFRIFLPIEYEQEKIIMIFLYRLFENKLATSADSKFIPFTLVCRLVTESRVIETVSYAVSLMVVFNCERYEKTRKGEWGCTDAEVF